jgi:hypothetical protein
MVQMANCVPDCRRAENRTGCKKCPETNASGRWVIFSKHLSGIAFSYTPCSTLTGCFRLMVMPPSV